jgi:hypothetical protein
MIMTKAFGVSREGERCKSPWPKTNPRGIFIPLRDHVAKRIVSRFRISTAAGSSLAEEK